MAGVKKIEVRMQAMAAVLLALTMMAVAVAARPAKDSKLKDSSCDTSEEYVYPYWSLCKDPAELSVGYIYRVVSLGGIYGETQLLPEYDETNDTYYVRIGSYGPTYAAVTESTDSGSLSTNSTVYIYNTDSKRVLTWRQEGTDEYFLIEKYTGSFTDGAPFRFLPADDVNLPCPLLYPNPICQAYTLVSEPSRTSATFSSSSYAGLKAYEEGFITYIKAAPAGSIGDLPLVLIRDSSSSTTTTTTTIRSVTAPEK